MLTVMAAAAQTLNVTVGSVTWQFPAAQAGEMTYSDGTTLTVMGKEFTLGDISAMTVDETEVTDNLVQIAYNGTSATVTVAGNVARYVTPTVSGAYVSIAQSNTDAVDDDEITYQLSGTSSDGQFALSGSYKCTVSLAGVDLTCTTGAALNITNKKRIQISAKKNTENTLADCADGSQKGCIYSKGQLQLQGNGVLNVAGNTAHAIKSADYVTVKNLTLNITGSVNDGINCNGYFQMKSGTVTMTGIGDEGIQCDLDGTESTGTTQDHEDEDSGSIYIDGGTLTVTASSTAAKCVKAEGDIAVSGGTVTLYANGAIDLTDLTDISYTAGFKAGGGFTQSGGDITVSVTGGAGRGIACDGTFTTTGTNTGTLTITNSGATSSGSSGTKYFCTAKSIKAGAVEINGGTIDITTTGAASKGIKADSDDGTGNITINGGTVTVKAQGTGAVDYTESDGKGCSALNADNNIYINGGTLTLTATNKGGKGIKCDGTLTITGGTVTATSSGSNYTSGSYSASAKAIKAGVKTTSGNKTTYSGGIVITGGTVVATASSHEAIESKSTIDISGGDVYAQSSDDAINSASTFNISGGFVMGYSTGNDGLDANGNFNISGGVVYAIGTSSPEVAIDANTEGGYKLTVTGGVIFTCGPLESGSTLTQSCYSASSITRNAWYSLTSGSTTYCFKTPSSLSVSTLVVSASSQPTVKSGVTVSGGTSKLNGMCCTGATASGGSSVSLSSYTASGGGGGGQPGGGGGPGGGGRW